MMGEEYTPATEQVREAYIWQDYEDGYHGPCPRDGAEFDRWFTRIRSDIWKQGAMAAIGRSVPPSMILNGNPFRSND